ncbi:WbqC family protein [Calditerrivibrio nitroreducens]|uniref:WbqC family protein n=1 Tax=Calditerrivibrio nitroreducens TaxID=477976 RepID=UPI003C76E55D
MICAIMQPTYNPWLGYFDLIDRVDCFVYLDNVQLVKRSWQVRNRIKSPNGDFFFNYTNKTYSSKG